MEYLTATSLWTYKDGNLYWKKTGKIAGYFHQTGYLYVSFKSKTYRVHRLIFLICKGYAPKIIDHVNCIKHDNRIENLREASNSQNQYNTTQRNNKPGQKNVFWEATRKKWRVDIRVGAKRSKMIGRFASMEEAELVAILAREKYHGIFANHGF